MNGEEEEEVECGWCLCEWVVMRGNWRWFIYVCIVLASLFVVIVLYLMCVYLILFSRVIMLSSCLEYV